MEAAGDYLLCPVDQIPHRWPHQIPRGISIPPQETCVAARSELAVSWILLQWDKQTHGWDRISTTDPKAFTILFLFLFLLIRRSCTTHLEAMLRNSPQQAAIVLIRIPHAACYSIYEFMGSTALSKVKRSLSEAWRYRYTFTWCFHLFCHFLLQGVIKACAWIIHNVLSHNTQSTSALPQSNITIMLFFSR